jgi:cytochrome P450
LLTASAINLSEPAFWEGPREERWPAFALLRRELPVAWQPPPVAFAPREELPPNGYWAVTRYDDVRAISRDPETFASGRGIMLFDNLPPELQRAYDGLLAIDGARHSQLRRVVSSAFTPRMMRSLQGFIEGAAGRAIRRVANRGECDFVDLVGPFPPGVICDMLGIPHSDRPELCRLMRVGTHIGSGAPADESIEACRTAVGYLVELARARHSRPGNDLTSALVQAEVDGSRLTDEDIGSVSWVLLTGGSEPTAMTATHAMLAFGRHRGERNRLQLDYATLADGAVEEMLRWGTSVIEFRRTATRDTEIAGQPIAEGDNVVLFYSSANQDETVFDSPERFDICREPNPHLAFGGGGPHFCLGAALARMELKTFFSELFRQLPDFDVSGDPTFAMSPVLDEISSLPCSFTPAPSEWSDD